MNWLMGLALFVLIAMFSINAGRVRKPRQFKVAPRMPGPRK